MFIAGIRFRVSRVAATAASLAIALPLAAGAAWAQTPAPNAAPAAAVAAPGKVIVPERTEVKLTLKEELRSGKSKTGQEVPFAVAQDVFGPGRVLLIEAGTLAYGKVTGSRKRGMFGKAGKLGFTCDYIRMSDGTRVALRSDPLGARGRDNKTASIATAILFAPVAIFMNGRDVTVDKGKEFTMYVDTNTEVPAPAVAQVAAPRTTPVAAPVAVSALPAAPAAPVALPAAPAPVEKPAPAAVRSLFVLKNNKGEVVGTLLGFDGTFYTVQSAKGQQKIKASLVKKIYPLAAK